MDDKSTDDTLDILRKKFSEHENILIIEKNENKKKSDSVNLGYKKSRGDFLFFVDDDVVLAKNTISELLNFCLKNGEKSFASPIMYEFNDRNKVWFAGLKINFWTTTGKFLNRNLKENKIKKKIIKTDAILTAFMVPRMIFSDIGYFNTELFPFQFEEMDFCVRSGFAGYELSVVTSVKLWHDHEKGVFLNNPWRLHYEVRNRIISAKLWSKNYIQILISRIFSLIIPLSYIIIKTLLFRDNYFQSIKSIFLGIRDGIVISRKIKPYYKRSKEELKFTPQK